MLLLLLAGQGGEPAERTFPTAFRVEVVATAEAGVEPARTRIVDL